MFQLPTLIQKQPLFDALFAHRVNMIHEINEKKNSQERKIYDWDHVTEFHL